VNSVPGAKVGMLAGNNDEDVNVAAAVIVGAFNRPPSTESPPEHTALDYCNYNSTASDCVEFNSPLDRIGLSEMTESQKVAPFCLQL